MPSRVLKALVILAFSLPPSFAGEGGFLSTGVDYPDYLTGVVIPMVTPYKGPSGEQLDLEALTRLTDYLCATSASALFPVSGTGQWRLLTLEEKKQVIKTCIKAAQGRKPILAGIGSLSSIKEVFELARFAEKKGADAVVAVTPEFLPHARTDQEVFFTYYRQICDQVKIPVVIYDPDSLLEPETLWRLIEACPRIKGIKLRETKNLEKFRSFAEAAKGKAAVLSGSEIVALRAIQNGAVGLIGNGMNLYPDWGMQLVKTCDLEDWGAAESWQKKITEANGRMEKLGGGAQGIKKILNDVIGVKMEVVNRGDTFRPESSPGEYQEIIKYFENLDLPRYHP